MKQFFVFCFSIFTILSCSTNDVEFSKELIRWNNNITKNPQSAWDSLQTLYLSGIKPNQKLQYYLLASAAATYTYYNDIEDSLLLNPEFSILRKEEIIEKLSEQTSKSNLYANAIVVLEDARNNIIESKDTTSQSLLGDICQSEAFLYHRLQDFQKTITLYRSALTYYKLTRDSMKILECLFNIADFYSLHQFPENTKEVVFQQIPAYLPSEKSTDSTSISLLARYNYIKGIYYGLTNDKETFFKYMCKNVELLEKINERIPFATYIRIIARSRRNKDIENMNLFCNRMIADVLENKDPKEIITAYKIIINNHISGGDYQGASKWQTKLTSYYESIRSQQYRERHTSFQKRYLQQTKEQILIENQNQLLMLITVIIIFMAIAVLIIFWLQNKKNKLLISNRKLKVDIQKTTWHFELSKEIISENTNILNQIDSILNQNIKDIPQKTFQDIHNTISMSKKNFTKELISIIINIDQDFTNRMRQLNSNLTTEEQSLAFMIFHKWTVIDISQIYHISQDAVKKRIIRLSFKILGRNASLQQFQTYLNNQENKK